jgi:acyl carrier protein
VESIGLVSIVAFIEQNLGIDLFSRANELAEARTIRDVANIVASIKPIRPDQGAI